MPILVALLLLLALVGCAGIMSVPQQDYTARNGLRVFDKADGSFEIIAQPGTSGSDYFCAAGDYARIMRNSGAADRVIVTRANGPTNTVPNGRSMTFRIGPPGPRTGGFITNAPMNRAGASFTVAASQSLCRTLRRGGIISTL